MPVEIQQLPIIFLIALSIALLLGVISLLVNLLGRVIRKSKGDQMKPPEQLDQKKTLTSGDQLNRSFQYALYLIIIEIVLIVVILPIYSFADNFAFVDYWPFLLFVFVLLITCLGIIDWARIRSKRTVQKELRRY